MAKSTRNAKAKAATAATPAARVEGAADDHGQAGNVAENAGGADGTGAGSAGAVADVAVPEGAVATEAAMGMPPADAGGARPDPALAEERVSSSATNTQEKPPRSDHEPEAHVDDRAGLQADTGAGDPDLTHTREHQGQGGGGDPAAPAGGLLASREETFSEIPPGGFEDPERGVNEFVAKYPRFYAAWEAWKAASQGAPLTAIRIASKVEGFRRAGMAHSKEPVDHVPQALSFEQIEQLLGERNLKVEFA